MIDSAPPLLVKRMHPDSKLPVYGSAGAGAFDVHAYIPGRNTRRVLIPGEHLMISTGLTFAVPEHFLMVMNIRSGMGANKGMRLRNTIGYIDSDYRGELMVCLHNNSSEDYVVCHEDRIAQCALVLAPQFPIVEVDELPDTERGEGGFGSTGS